MPFLQHLSEELELRVGTKLAEGLNNDQLLEFEGIIERKPGKIEEWLAANEPNYETNIDYIGVIQKFLVQNKGASPNDEDIKAEFVATKWLEKNRSNYKEVVASTLEELRTEILANREHFLAA